jgi:hypothetical protein
MYIQCTDHTGYSYTGKVLHQAKGQQGMYYKVERTPDLQAFIEERNYIVMTSLSQTCPTQYRDPDYTSQKWNDQDRPWLRQLKMEEIGITITILPGLNNEDMLLMLPDQDDDQGMQPGRKYPNTGGLGTKGKRGWGW